MGQLRSHTGPARTRNQDLLRFHGSHHCPKTKLCKGRTVQRLPPPGQVKHLPPSGLEGKQDLRGLLAFLCTENSPRVSLVLGADGRLQQKHNRRPQAMSMFSHSRPRLLSG